MICGGASWFPKNKAIERLLGNLDKRQLFRCEIMKEREITRLKCTERLSRIQIHINGVRIMNGSKDIVGCLQQIKRVYRAIAKFKVVSKEGERFAWRVTYTAFAKSDKGRLKLTELRLDRDGNCSCTTFLGLPRLCELAFSGYLHSFRMSFALCNELGFCFCLFIRCFLAHVLLPDECDRESCKRKARLSPRCPFALSDAKRAVEPAAIIDRIGHVTSPVVGGVIVCVGHA